MARHQDLHLTLPLQTARAVDRLARARGMKRTQVLRLAVDALLEQAEREARNEEMRAYVAEMAAHSSEFVRESGKSVTRKLLEETEW